MNVKIVIAEDDLTVRKFLKRTLEENGYEVIAVGDGRAALHALRDTNCQIVISDWEMPHMTGLDMCKKIRNTNFGRYIYTILVTSHDSTDYVVKGLEGGADDFVRKPYSPAEILVRLRGAERILALETAEMTIFAMAKLAASRDSETGAHIERVRCYCRVLSEQLGRHQKFKSIVDQQFITLIYQTSPLHDLGKVAIPDSVLMKPGLHTDSEYEIMKSHTVLGAETLEAALERYPNARFLRMARDIAISHHERWDGNGYPKGLKGKQIPLSGRIVALADVYDALSSKRVYKASFTPEVVRSMIVQERGKHFDPDLVDAYLEVEDEFLRIREEHQDEHGDLPVIKKQSEAA